MQQIGEEALLGFCFQPLNESGIFLESIAPEQHLADVHRALVGLLNEESGNGRVERNEKVVPRSDLTGLGFIFGRRKQEGETVRLYTFGLTDAASQTALPLLGIALTVFTAIPGWALLPQGLGVLKALWSKLVVLSRPADADAIDTLETLVSLRARRYAAQESDLPTSAELLESLAMPQDRLGAALSSLSSRQIIKAKNWGGQRDDVLHPATSWSVRL